MKDDTNILIIGGGLAGMAAAIALESIGKKVTLLEAGRRLGGRASSFDDPKTGEELDNCQHVLLGCCTNLIDFYKRMGVSDRIQWEAAIHFVDGDAREYSLASTPRLPAPLHLGLSMAKFGILSWSERIAATRAMLEMMQLGRKGRANLADITFGEWLDAHEQPASLLPKLYDPVLVGSLNEQCRPASAEYAIQVFQDALLAHSQGFLLGLPNCPLRQLYENLPCKDVRMGTRVTDLIYSGDRVIAVKLANGETLNADAVILATNHHATARMLPVNDPRLAGLERLESVPILGVHLWFDRPILTQSHAALIEGPLQWLFRKDHAGKSVHGVISAAREWVDVPKEECLRQFEAQVRLQFPASREATLERGVVVVEKRATFAPTPGVDRLRPHQAPPAGAVKNLYLAGDYTRTGWPATMEGAVRSGYLAAEAVSGTRFLIDDLPVQWPMRMLS